jgi:hypothetical protein
VTSFAAAKRRDPEPPAGIRGLGGSPPVAKGLYEFSPTEGRFEAARAPRGHRTDASPRGTPAPADRCLGGEPARSARADT